MMAEVIQMKLPITIGDIEITRRQAGRGMVRLIKHGESIGRIESNKVLDDLPRVLGRKLTIEEQVAITLAVPGAVVAA
ncbi:hypothetical protein FD02_GL001053 [Lacticaseibacillus nasuensis JCM 17158]|uniref:Uncharacterized protein n=2 Tax=Lacticaseibacillus TaxID=2759736 RepID=A0A0R1JPG2_9LACO|nr:hypothetical protein FD02_GL001053 [Lacticaseibacillus nasuensis JCM 17158]